MINKIFFSYYLEGEQPFNSNQIRINKNQIAHEISQDQKASIQLRDKIHIDSQSYDISFMGKLYQLDLMSIGEFLDFHRDEYEGSPEDFIKKIHFMSDYANTFHFSYKNDYRLAVQDWVDTQKLQSLTKLKWIGKTAQFGYIFLELAKNGYIEIPQTRNKNSFKKYARICFDLFDIDTTLGTLEKELSEGNNLDPSNREFFKIPHISELS